MDKLFRKHDDTLEGLRGICALTVCYAHVFTFGFFKSNKLIFSNFLSHLHFASVAVLIFFILSGYVIGQAYCNTKFTLKDSQLYLKKRLVRLYPIYIFAVLLSTICSKKPFSSLQIIGNLCFLQEFFVKTIPGNVVLWSLSYEVVFYFLFIIIWKWFKKEQILYLIISSLLISISSFLIFKNHPIISSLSSGWFFWLVGLAISWTLPESTKSQNHEGKPYLSYLFLLLSTYYLGSGTFFLGTIKMNMNTNLNVNLSDIFYLPICATLFLGITSREFAYRKYLLACTYLIPTAHIALLLLFRHDLTTKPEWFYGSIYCLLSFCVLPYKTRSNAFAFFSSIGKISYAIYVFHFPLAYIINSFSYLLENNTLICVLGLIVWAVVTYYCAFVAERIFQPAMKQLLLGNNRR